MYVCVVNLMLSISEALVSEVIVSSGCSEMRDKGIIFFQKILFIYLFIYLYVNGGGSEEENLMQTSHTMKPCVGLRS